MGLGSRLNLWRRRVRGRRRRLAVAKRAGAEIQITRRRGRLRRAIARRNALRRLLARRRRRFALRHQIGKHFRFEEFACRDGTPCPRYMRRALGDWAWHVGEPMRRKFGVVTVLSGYRTAVYNIAVGGARHSYHVYTDRRADPAVDFRCARGTPDEWGAEARRLLGREGGVGIYPSQGFTHADTRRVRADWRG